jgi:putative membrane-bound dehydrogenase-like protein
MMLDARYLFNAAKLMSLAGSNFPTFATESFGATFNMVWRRMALASALFLSAISCGLTQTPQRYPAVSATNAIRTFHVHDGFFVQLVASEPLVVDPGAMAFDEEGRLFVVEMRDYPLRADTNSPLGQIRMLVDTNSDGVFDVSTVYAKNLPLPSSVICYGGGVFVTATPDILYLKDDNGDGISDTREVVFTGFGNVAGKSVPTTMLNGLTWGLDNRIHGVTSDGGGNIMPVKSRQPGPIPLRSKDFSFDPRMFTIEPETGTGQFGMSFDSRGRKFLCESTHGAKMVMYETRYASRNPFYAPASPMIDLASTPALIYRLTPTNIFSPKFSSNRIATTPTHFSTARGITIYRGNAFPIDYQETEFVCDANANLVHHDRLRENGIALVAERSPEPMEFLASRDPWFHPVALANGPDGALYIADMYRENIAIGNESGRIYRVISRTFKQPPPINFRKAATTNLVTMLASPNGWHRDTAARLIYERQDKTAIPFLNRMLESPAPFGRLHALCALDGLQALTEANVARAFGDRDERVREHAVRLSEKLIPANGAMNDSLWAGLAGLRSDPAPRVRYQLALTAGQARHRRKTTVLTDILRRDPQDKWTRAAVLSSLAENGGEMFAQVVNDRRLRSNASAREFLNELALLIGTSNNTNEIVQTMHALLKVDDVPLAYELWSSLGDGLRRSKNALTHFDPAGTLGALYYSAAVNIDRFTGTNAMRMGAIRLLSETTFAYAGSIFLNLLSAEELPEVKIAALHSLRKFPEPEVSAGIMQRWASMSPQVRAEAMNVLLSRRDGMAALLAGLRNGVIRPRELNAAQIATFLNHHDQQIRDEALKVLGKVILPSRPEALAQFQPTLKLGGRVQNGREIFRARCAFCHRVGNETSSFGVNAEPLRATGKEKLLIDIVDPNCDVPPDHVVYFISTKDSETIAGTILNESPRGILIHQASGLKRFVPISNVEQILSEGTSLMPEGLESGLSPQDMADLLEFITTESRRTAQK